MIIIFCGIPGSGKSTIARGVAKALQKLGKSYRLFVSDKIPGRLYKQIPKILKENLGKVDYILLDATFYKKKWRDMVFKLARGEKILTVYIYAPLKTCLKRNKNRQPRIPEKVVHIMHREMEKPRHPDFSINTNKIKPKEAISRILWKI